MTGGRLRGATARVATAADATRSELGEYGTLINGQWLKTGDAIEIRSPYDDFLVAIVHRAGSKEIEDAIVAAVAAFKVTRNIPSWRRAEILEKISAGIAARHEEFARTIALEAGKPIRTARLEVDRAIFTFKVAAEESKRIYGEIVPLDWIPGQKGEWPTFNAFLWGRSPELHLSIFRSTSWRIKWPRLWRQDVPILLRPASQTPVSTLKLGEVVLESGWPEGGFAAVPSTTDCASPLVEDGRLKKLTFTGSPAVGWALKARAGHKRVTLELGGNAGNIIHRDADVPYAAGRSYSVVFPMPASPVFQCSVFTLIQKFTKGSSTN